MATVQSTTSLASVAQAFEGLNKTGNLLKLTGGPFYNASGDSHLQGIARYGNYYLITQNYKDHDSGRLYFFDATTLKYVNDLHLHADSSAQNSHDHCYNHPGGIQVIGNYLLIPIQTQDYKQSLIQLWDISSLDNGDTNIKQLSNDFIPDSDNKEIGGIGITAVSGTFLVAACNNTVLYFYQSTGDNLESASFSFLFQYQMQDSADEVCLITEETTNAIFLIALYSLGDEPMVDYATLYQVDLANKTLDQVQNRHFVTVTPLGILSYQDVHFRYGSGINITDEGALNLLATERVMQPHCDINIFE